MILKIISTIFLQAATYASLIGLYFTIIPLGQPRAEWHWIIIILSTFAALALTWREIRDIIREGPKTYKSKEKINRYMCRWVSSGGRVVIFSRDLSWAGEEEVRDVLARKAERGDLTVCIENDIQLTSYLKTRGARIVTYGGLGFVPKSRFTIIDFEKEGARVAVGVHENGSHIIQEFRSGAHPFFAVAEDMVRFMMKVEENGIS
jgi:hypothetical protein